MVLKIVDFVRCFPQAKNEDLWCNYLNKFLPKYGIVSKLRLIHFLTQCGYESANFTRFEENLFYTTESALKKTFSRYIDKDNVDKYLRNPKGLANYVYSDSIRKHPLGNNLPGDGWKYRGRGIIQLTGKDNYSRFAEDNNLHLNSTPNYISSKQGAVHSACWYWDVNNLNNLADKNDFLRITKRVVGSNKNQYKREKLFDSISKVIYGDFISIKQGDKGLLVKKVQEKLNITADGIFGDQTKEAVVSFTNYRVSDRDFEAKFKKGVINRAFLSLLFNEK